MQDANLEQTYQTHAIVRFGGSRCHLVVMKCAMPLVSEVGSGVELYCVREGGKLGQSHV